MITKSSLPYIIAGATGAIIASVIPLLLTSSQADTKLLPFQGRLTDSAGTAIADGAKVVEFKMYDAPTGGNVKWAGEVHKLSINGGLVNTMLGSKTSLGSVDFSTPTYLQITVDAQAVGAPGSGAIDAADPPLLPRQSVIGSVYASVAGGIQYSTGQGTFSTGGWEKVFSGGNPDTGRIDGSKIAGSSVGLSALSAEAIANLGASGSLTQGSLVPSMTAQETIEIRDAVAITKDAGNNVRLWKANSSVGSRSAFYGFAKAAAAINAPVTIHQFGALTGFTGSKALSAGSSYYVGTTNGTITPIYPAGNPIYVGYALASDTLFVDPFGVTKKWSNQNYWGNGNNGQLSTTQNISFTDSQENGDVVVKQYTNLTINEGHTMTVQNRCRGLVIYVDGNCTINGTLTMTKRGASADPTQPNSIASTGIRLIRRKAGATETLPASDVGGTGLGGVGSAWRSVETLQPGIDSNGKIFLITSQGGAGGLGNALYNGGNPGNKLDFGTGGGGARSGSSSYVGESGAAGTCFSGGSAAGAPSSGNGSTPNTGGALFGGAGGQGNVSGNDQPLGAGGGGGAGNPGGIGGTGPLGNGAAGETGTGGLLVLFVRGNLSISASALISANGAVGGVGGNVHAGSGGGSGGGRIILLHAGSLNNTGTVQANGGLGGQGNYQGKNGGDGAITVDQVDP